MHTTKVEAWLHRLDLEDNDLECGPHAPYDEPTRDKMIRLGEAPCRVHNNCSGKHTGFLTLAKHLKAPTAHYTALDHPVQKLVRARLSSLCDVPEQEFHPGTDGCTAPNFALPLRNLALGFARMASGTGISKDTHVAAQRLFAAQVRYPRLMSGTGRACADLIEAGHGHFVVKTGAEGVYAGLVPGLGVGIALKIDDGAKRASEAAIAALLVALGCLKHEEPHVQALIAPPWINTRGGVSGEGRITDMLRPEISPETLHAR